MEHTGIREKEGNSETSCAAQRVERGEGGEKVQRGLVANIDCHDHIKIYARTRVDLKEEYTPAGNSRQFCSDKVAVEVQW